MADLRIDNHRPVPLLPLAELDYEDGGPIYLGLIVGEHGDVYGHPGWYCWDDVLQDFIRLDALGSGSVNENLSGWQDLDEQKTLARLLQPGERLILTLEG